ncbi:MAG: CDP-archaeol synthase [bacterium]
MLKHRLQTGVLLSIAFLLCVFFLPAPATLVVLLLLCGLSLVEFYSFLDARRIPHFKIVGLISGLALVGGTWLAMSYLPALGADADTVLLFGATAAILLRQVSHRDDVHPWQTMAGTLLGVMYVAFFFTFIVKLLTAWGDQEGRFLILFLVVVVKCTDIGAYFTGCGIGRHKFIPRISPNKTWEGCIGGVACGMLASYLYLLARQGRMGEVIMHTHDALIAGFILAVTGIAGDLIESLLKRAAGVKDSGTMLLGMGGILDVLDSLLFAAPVLYVYALLFMTG